MGSLAPPLWNGAHLAVDVKRSCLFLRYSVVCLDLALFTSRIDGRVG